LTYRSAIDSLIDILAFDPLEMSMETITISPKFQVVIPKAIREELGLTPGQKMQAVLYEDRIELVVVRPARRLRGFLKGIDVSVPRDPDRA
jgi:AbrB family looped-hinge helix DNA binding protein